MAHSDIYAQIDRYTYTNRLAKCSPVTKAFLALATVGMTNFADKPPHFLSGGQKKQVALAGALAMQPEVIIMDEPTSSLDPIATSGIMHLMLQLNKEKGDYVNFSYT